MANTSLFILRQELKAQILRERGPRCELDINRRAHDMHEVFVTRSDYPFPDRQAKIFSKYNCVLLNHTLHVEKGLTAQDKLILGRKLIHRYGRDVIQRWINSLELRTWGTLENWEAKLESHASAKAS